MRLPSTRYDGNNLTMGHGDHWHALGLEPQDIVERLLPLVADEGKVAYTRGNGGFPDPYSSVYSQVYPEGPVQFMLLMAVNKYQREVHGKTWFPYLAEGYEHEIVIDQIGEWKSPFEGLIQATLGNAWIAFFAPLWAYEHWPKEGRVDCRLAALAYSLGPVPEHTGEIVQPPESLRELLSGMDPAELESLLEPKELSFIGARGFLPSGDGWPEDASYVTVIDKVEELQLLDIPLWRLEIGMFVDSSGEEEAIPRIPLYAAQAACQPGYTPKVGDTIQGVCWLQGVLATSHPQR